MSQCVKDIKVDVLSFWMVVWVGVFILISPANVMSEELLDAPRPMAMPGYILILLPDRDCNHEFRVERSFDLRTWVALDVVSAYKNPILDPDFRECANDVVDSSDIAKETEAVYYRYMQVDAERIIQTSQVGTLDMKKVAQDYWYSDSMGTASKK